MKIKANDVKTVFGMGFALSIFGLFFHMIRKTNEIYDLSCDVHYHSKADKSSWDSLQKQMMNDIIAERMIIERERQARPDYSAEFPSPGTYDLIYQESSDTRYLCDKKDNDTLVIQENIVTCYEGINHYKHEASHFGFCIETYTGTTYTPYQYYKKSPSLSLQDEETPELFKARIRAAFAESAKLNTYRLSPSQLRQACTPRAEKIMLMIENHHKQFGCDHGRDEHIFAGNFLGKSSTTEIPAYSPNPGLKDFLRF